MTGEDTQEAEIVLSAEEQFFLLRIYSRKTFEGGNPFAIFYGQVQGFFACNL